MNVHILFVMEFIDDLIPNYLPPKRVPLLTFIFLSYLVPFLILYYLCTSQFKYFFLAQISKEAWQIRSLIPGKLQPQRKSLAIPSLFIRY